MTRFIISESITNYFVVEAEGEDEAFDKVSYRNPNTLKPDDIDVIGYDLVEENSIVGYMILESLKDKESL